MIEPVHSIMKGTCFNYQDPYSPIQRWWQQKQTYLHLVSFLWLERGCDGSISCTRVPHEGLHSIEEHSNILFFFIVLNIHTIYILHIQYLSKIYILCKETHAFFNSMFPVKTAKFKGEKSVPEKISNILYNMQEGVTNIRY